MKQYVFDFMGWISAAMASVIGFFLYRTIGTIDAHDIRLDMIEKNCVTADDLKEAKRENKEERQEVSRQLEALGRKIDDGFNAVHKRVDNLYKRDSE